MKNFKLLLVLLFGTVSLCSFSLEAQRPKVGTKGKSIIQGNKKLFNDKTGNGDFEFEKSKKLLKTTSSRLSYMIRLVSSDIFPDFINDLTKEDLARVIKEIKFEVNRNEIGINSYGDKEKKKFTYGPENGTISALRPFFEMPKYKAFVFPLAGPFDHPIYEIEVLEESHDDILKEKARVVRNIETRLLKEASHLFWDLDEEESTVFANRTYPLIVKAFNKMITGRTATKGDLGNSLTYFQMRQLVRDACMRVNACAGNTNARKLMNETLGRRRIGDRLYPMRWFEALIYRLLDDRNIMVHPSALSGVFHPNTQFGEIAKILAMEQEYPKRLKEDK